jgi:hypothetical protein
MERSKLFQRILKIEMQVKTSWPFQQMQDASCSKYAWMKKQPPPLISRCVCHVFLRWTVPPFIILHYCCLLGIRRHILNVGHVADALHLARSAQQNIREALVLDWAPALGSNRPDQNHWYSVPHNQSELGNGAVYWKIVIHNKQSEGSQSPWTGMVGNPFYFFSLFCLHRLLPCSVHRTSYLSSFPPTRLFCFYRDVILWTICLSWPRTAILLLSDSQVTRNTGLSH